MLIISTYTLIPPKAGSLEVDILGVDGMTVQENIVAAKPYLFWGKATDISEVSSRRVWRFFEMLPGMLSFGTIALLILFSFVAPASVAIFIILFELIWLMRAASLSLHVVLSYRKVRRALKTDWRSMLAALHNYNPELGVSSWHDVWHVVILPMYKEPRSVLEETLDALAASNYPHEKLLVVVACEERAGETQWRMAREVAARFRAGSDPAFAEIIVTSHPANIAGEIAGKGSNEAWAAKEAVRLLVEPRAIDPRRVIVSSFDIDTRPYPNYFLCLAYTFLTAQDPLRTSYQPIPLYNNNIWYTPAFSRLVATGNTIWQMIQQVRPEQMETFSSHAMSLDALIKIGFWNTRVVSEDSLIFYQAFLAFEGHYRVIPLFYPVSLDANVAESLPATIMNVYRQQRRWAYGAEKIPYLFYGFLKSNRISLRKKIFHTWVILDGFWSWACASLIIFAFGWIPTAAGGEEFRSTVLAANLPYVTSFLLNIALVGIVINGVVSFVLLPPRPKNVSLLVLPFFILQWALLPIIIIFFGSLPALDAQLRLLLGKYMGFWVTPKSRTRK